MFIKVPFLVLTKFFILRELMTGTKRFGEIHSSINGVSQKVLTQKLREMESDGLINRVAYAEIPPRVEYSLTDLGMSLRPVLDSLKEWGDMYKGMEAS